MRYVGPIAYKNKLTVDNRGIDQDTKIHLREGAPVTCGSGVSGLPPILIGTVDWVWDSGSEIWAALELNGTPPGEDDLFPQIDLDYSSAGNVERRNGSQAWFINDITIIGCHLGDCPGWTDLPPVKPS